jgi:hypothetical protein
MLGNLITLSLHTPTHTNPDIISPSRQGGRMQLIQRLKYSTCWWGHSFTRLGTGVLVAGLLFQLTSMRESKVQNWGDKLADWWASKAVHLSMYPLCVCVCVCVWYYFTGFSKINCGIAVLPCIPLGTMRKKNDRFLLTRQHLSYMSQISVLNILYPQQH